MTFGLKHTGTDELTYKTVNNSKITYKSSKTAVATVSKSGLITTKKTGTTTITLTYDSVSSKFNLVVTGSGTVVTPTTTETETHTHNWQAVTKQEWVVDEEAWEEEVYVKSVCVCTACDAEFDTSTEFMEHNFQMGLTGDESHTYGVVERYKTIVHPEKGHYKTITTGYKCSTCGKTK